MAKRAMTVDDLWSLPRVGPPAPAPDGGLFVVPVTRYDVKANEGTTRLWLVPGDARKAGKDDPRDPARPLTSADVSCSQASWCPDGEWLAFVRKPGGKKVESGIPGPKFPDEPQVYVMPVNGGEAERMTDLPLGAADPRWFPDGRRVAFLGEVYAGVGGIEQVAATKKERDEDPVKAYVTEDRVYRYWDRWLTEGRVHHVFVLDTETGALVDLTPDSARHFSFMDPSDSFRISPDGREIVFSACRSDPPYDPLAWGVYSVKVPARVRAGLKAPKVVPLTDGIPGNAFRPVYSPDGRQILYGRTEDLLFYADRVRLVLRDRTTGAETVLTERWDRSPSAWEFSDDGRTVVVLAEEHGRTALFALDVEKASRAPEENLPSLVGAGGGMTGLSVAAGRAWFGRSDLASPPEAWSLPLAGGAAVRHTAFTDEAMTETRLSRVKTVSFTGAGGEAVSMYLLAPPGESFPSRKSGAKPRWPLVHLIHGGPHGIFGDEWHWRWNAQTFAAPGRLVALVNFHGSTSWGQDFAGCIRGRWGDQPFVDIEAATDLLVAEGLADPGRMAVAGGSYGGYLVSWICARTDRYACAVNHAGVSDLQTQYASDVTQGRRESLGGEPWDDVEGLDRYNPMRHASGFRTPMLVVHGQKDYRVPYNQGLEIYNVLKAMGVPARLVVYPDENHWVLKPRNSRHWYGEVLGWLDRWLS